MPNAVPRARIFLVFAILGLLSALFASACSLIVDSDSDKVGPRPLGCFPGTLVQCPCEDGTSSQQVCDAAGKYEPCMCATAQAGTGG
jgi:hypothetical protein